MALVAAVDTDRSMPADPTGAQPAQEALLCRSTCSMKSLGLCDYLKSRNVRFQADM